jgi:hypothetical protein
MITLITQIKTIFGKSGAILQPLSAEQKNLRNLRDLREKIHAPILPLITLIKNNFGKWRYSSAHLHRTKKSAESA